jgi:hypothetical protein
MLRTVQFVAGLFLLIALEILKVYFIMPFPGSQRAETVAIAYFLHDNIFYFRIIGWLFILFPALYFFTIGKLKAKIVAGLGLVVYLCVFYLFNYRFLADKMFYQLQNKVFAPASLNKVPENSLILGVNINSESKAFPVEVIGYHHQVRDTIGNVPVMITYCTVCRTGRVYSPEVDGKIVDFRLVGMDHFNAMFEDASTRTWWRQVNGEAIAGPLKGHALPELFSEQMTLKSWLKIHPETKILQPDTVFAAEYKALAEFDEGTIESGLEKRDSLSWQDKSWVIGLQLGMHVRAYDWNDLLKLKVINDTLAGSPVLVVIEPDSVSFHVWKRDSLTFVWDDHTSRLKDVQTNSSWNWQGSSTEGQLRGNQLLPLQSYQEFWHSWNTFRPQTTRYIPNNSSK